MVEDYAYVLDYLPRGRPDDPRRKDPVAYGVGEKNFVILELVPRPDAKLMVGDRVYLGREPDEKGRSPIDHVRGRVRFEDTTHAAQSELPFLVEKIVKAQEERFIKFFNEAGPVTTRMHMLELLPGLGKKLMWAIVEERKKGPFKGFADMDTRVKALHQPEKLIANRIASEITNPNEKYHLFVQPPAPEGEGFGPPRGPRGRESGPVRGP
jgi:putative nucleotide binding protein